MKVNLNSRIAVIADGSAFGPEIEDLSELQKESNGMLALYLPESFEWIVLQSGVVCNPTRDEIMHPQNYAESSEYASWERYFTKLLIEYSAQKKYGYYSKKKISSSYLQDSAEKQILSAIPAIHFIRQKLKRIDCVCSS